jgi:dolichol-phosphate mannosyltransferase
MKLSLVVPVFNEEEVLPELKRRVDAVLPPLVEDYEVVFVDDGSSDRSAEILGRFADDPHVVVVKLSRNFGHQQAITAGVSVATGDALVIMDGDLEDPPELVAELLKRWREGFKIVIAQRRSRRATFLRKVLFAAFHRLFRFLSETPVPLDSGVFCLLDRVAYRQLAALGESNRFIPGLRSWIGYRTTCVLYDREDRYSGEPRQSLWNLLEYALDAIFSFSYKPLRISLLAGFCIFFLTSTYAFILLVLRILNINVVSGFTTTSVSILFLGGAILVSNGILGEYLGRVYDEVKRRPLYVIEEVIRRGGPA